MRKIAVLLACIVTLGIAATVQAGGNNGNTGVIDFEGLAEGDIPDELSEGAGVSGKLDGVIKVDGFNPDFGGGTNAAMVYDTSCPPTYTSSDCSGKDKDLGTPNEAFKFKPAAGSPIPGPGKGDEGFPSNSSPLGNVLIISEDLDQSDPDDADNKNMRFEFDFDMVDGDVEIDSFTVIDIEDQEGGTFAEFFTNGSVVPTDMVAIPATGDNGVMTIKGLDLQNVDKMVINLDGSGGVASVVYGARVGGTCWFTSGGFQNAGIVSGGKDYTFGGNVGPPPSGSWEVVDHNTGDNFHSNDVERIECGVIEALTGPEQPGGKKGLEENILFFKGTGRLRAGDGAATTGHPFQGCTIDAGEPAGKQGLDHDYFEIVVCDSGEVACDFGSGRCSTDVGPSDLQPPGPQNACDDLVANNPAVVFAACGELDGGNFQIHPPTGNN